MELRGKIAVITGAASGIGRAAALRLRKEGAAGLVLGALNLNELKTTSESVEGIAMQCDVSKEADIQKLVREAETRNARRVVFFYIVRTFHQGAIQAPA